ncbi:MAG: 2-oxo-4-hydroxy-4-carboxy-5-ureidoimidazoline decarboxylase [Bacteroidota bacterium]
MKLDEINTMSTPAVKEWLTTCCGSGLWIDKMVSVRPFESEEDLLSKAGDAWRITNEEDWLEAFRHHPKIGDLESLKKKFATTEHLASSEQAAVNHAADATLRELAEGNDAYEQRFGFIFIVCATGKSADEMLSLLKLRLRHDRDEELRIAAGEQLKITLLRLKKSLS